MPWHTQKAIKTKGYNQMNFIQRNQKNNALLNLNAEQQYCIDYILKFWDLSSIEFKDPDKSGDPKEAFIKECFDYGTHIARSSFYETYFFHHVYEHEIDRINYLKDIGGISFSAASKEPIVLFLRTFTRLESAYSELVNKKTNNLLNNFVDATEDCFSLLTNTFSGIQKIKPIGFDEYAEKYEGFGTELIHAYQHKARKNKSFFQGTSFTDSQFNFAERTSLGNVSYQELEQGFPSFKELIGCLLTQAKTLKAFNNSIQASLIIDNIALKDEFFEQEFNINDLKTEFKPVLFFAKNIIKEKIYDFEQSEIDQMSFKYSFKEYLAAVNEQDDSEKSKAIRKLIASKEEPKISKNSIDSLMNMINEKGMLD